MYDLPIRSRFPEIVFAIYFCKNVFNGTFSQTKADLRCHLGCEGILLMKCDKTNHNVEFLCDSEVLRSNQIH